MQTENREFTTRLTRRLMLTGFAVLAGLALVSSAQAGTISLAWDPVPDADLAGYKIYVGTAPQAGDVAILQVGNVTQADIVGLPDCAALHVAIRAVDLSGNESTNFSNSVDGMTRPEVASFSPRQFEQMESATVTIDGASFHPGITADEIDFGSDEVRVLDVNWLSCTELEVEVAVGPFTLNPGDPGYNGAGGEVELIDPAEEGAYPLLVDSPDGLGGLIAGTATCEEQDPADCPTVSVLQVAWLEDRTDTDLSGRVDGWDLARLARSQGSNRCTPEEAGAGECNPNAQPLYDASVDFNGDKQVDSLDLTYFAGFFGEVF